MKQAMSETKATLENAKDFFGSNKGNKTTSTKGKATHKPTQKPQENKISIVKTIPTATDKKIAKNKDQQKEDTRLDNLHTIQDKWNYFNTMVSVSSTKFVCDEKYQRDFGEAKVRAMFNSFDRLKVGCIILSQRAPGQYAIVDGHHRVQLYKRINARCAKRNLAFNDMIPALIFNNITEQEEAEIFIGYNKTRKPTSAYETFRAEVAAERQQAVRLLELIEKHGFKIGPKVGQDTIGSLNGLQKLQSRTDGEMRVEAALTILREVWKGDPKSLNSELIYTLGSFGRYYDNFNQKTLVIALKHARLDDIINKHIDLIKEHNCGATEAYVRVLEDVYNTRTTNYLKQRPFRNTKKNNIG